MSKIDISVIIPMYNAKKYIFSCVENILKAEEYGLSLEVIIVNDCSKDDAMDILMERYSGDERVVLINQEKNAGPGEARNRGIEEARGEYITFVDSDDGLRTDAYDKMLKDEQIKQERIAELIKKAKKEQEDMLEDNKFEYAGLEKELINDMSKEASINKENVKKAADEFNNTTANLKEEFDKLVAEKKSLSKNLASLADKFTRIDDEVFASTEELKDKYMAELLKIRKSFEENRIRKQKELSALDTMSGKVDDIFKNFN